MSKITTVPHAPKISNFSDDGKLITLDVKFPNVEKATVRISSDFKRGARDLTAEEYQTMLFRNFDLKKNQSLVFFINGGLGDAIIAIEVCLAVREFLKKFSKAKFEFIALFESNQFHLFERYLASANIFDRFEVVHDQYDFKFKPNLLIASPHEIRVEYFSLGSMWDLLWARWGLPGQFKECYPTRYLEKAQKLAAAEFQTLRHLPKFPKKNDYVLIVPEDASGKHKLWPLEHWIRLLKKLLRSTDCEYVILSTNRLQLEKLRFDKRIHVYDYVEHHGDFTRLLSLIYGSRGVISLDTGPAHAAGHISKPCITLFGPSNPVYYGHRNNFNVRLSACPPCWPRQRMEICQNNICLQELDPEQIALFARQRFGI